MLSSRVLVAHECIRTFPIKILVNDLTTDSMSMSNAEAPNPLRELIRVLTESFI